MSEVTLEKRDPSTDIRTGKTLSRYLVLLDGEPVGQVGQFMTYGHYRGIRPNSGTLLVRRWGITESTGHAARISTLQWPFETRAAAVKRLLESKEA